MIFHRHHTMLLNTRLRPVLAGVRQFVLLESILCRSIQSALVEPLRADCALKGNKGFDRYTLSAPSSTTATWGRVSGPTPPPKPSQLQIITCKVEDRSPCFLLNVLLYCVHISPLQIWFFLLGYWALPLFLSNHRGCGPAPRLSELRNENLSSNTSWLVRLSYGSETRESVLLQTVHQKSDKTHTDSTFLSHDPSVSCILSSLWIKPFTLY